MANKQTKAAPKQQTQKKVVPLPLLAAAVIVVVAVILLWPRPQGTDQSMTNVYTSPVPVTHYARIDIKDYGVITVALAGETAPKTVETL